MTHTPGPWAINENGDIVKDGARFTIAALLPGAGVTSREVVANTRLIAAAPDLLEAAIEALWIMPGGADDARCHNGICSRSECRTCQRRDALAAAVDKARGIEVPS